MPTTVPALVAPSAGAPFERSTISRRDVGAHDVWIEIAFVGICHSDIHEVREEWGTARFPMVPGHEIAGVVSAIGSAVTRHAVGDRVGVGCFVDSCRSCASCARGEEQYCRRGYVDTYNGLDYAGEPTHGGYSSAIVVHEDYVLRIPAGLALEAAAPLLCAGVTMFSALRHWRAGAGTQVGIVGMGGLGHLGVKIGAALGAEVAVLSRTLAKQEDGRRFGAERCLATSDPATFEQLEGRLDLVLNTVSGDLDVDRHLSLLAPDGALVFVGLPESAQQFRPFGLASARRSLAGSNIGGIRETQETLDFCAEHGIGAEVETIGADDVTDAYDRVVRSDVRYRFVLDAATIGS